MEVILLEKIRNLGKLGEVVNVKRGYGRNYLVPQGKAAYATADNLAKFEARRAELEKVEAKHLAAAKTRQEALTALGVIVIPVKAGEEGKLFGSISTRDIADAVTTAGFELDKSEVHLPTGALRHTGEYDVEVELHSEVSVMIKLNVVAEE